MRSRFGAEPGWASTALSAVELTVTSVGWVLALGTGPVNVTRLPRPVARVTFVFIEFSRPEVCR
ncbi:hypothetical protein GCM10009721_14640 [Terrabacter tumescens]|uniref:Uncharacterized protein n=1 Tax=Terrabacter tumescens TaxID=60443 RepID=A0ABQ2HSG4_9MICO|nr:hypothetical protein GCM10009721_14640 [Terrabacter tumescens]